MPESQAEISLGFVPVVRQTAPAVVSIYTRKVVERRASPFAGDPFFERFFGDMFPGGQSRRRIENSLGSGVVVTAFTDIFGFFSFLAIGTLLTEHLA